jgi:hypothetical protein
MAVTWGLEVLESEVEVSVDVGDIWPDPVDAVDAELLTLNAVDDAELDVEDELDVGLLDVEPGITPRITVPTGTVKVDTPTVQQLSPQQ